MKLAVGVMARSPKAEGKTRLAPHLDSQTLAALREAMLADTLAAVCAAARVDALVFVAPDDRGHDVLAHAPRILPVLPQGAGDLGERMQRALSELIDARGYDGAILVGSDVPLLTPEHVAEAANLLRTRGGVVIGPADDGGYYLLGMSPRVFGELFDGIEWGSDSVLDATLRTAQRNRIDACLIRGAYDIDTIEDLRRLERDLEREPLDVAVHTRRALAGGGRLGR